MGWYSEVSIICLDYIPEYDEWYIWVRHPFNPIAVKNYVWPKTWWGVITAAILATEKALKNDC